MGNDKLIKLESAMFFKNLSIYRLKTSFLDFISDEAMNIKLQLRPIEKPSPLSFGSAGWVSPIGNEKVFAHQVNNAIMICMKQYVKTIPVAAVNEELGLRVIQIEKEEKRTVLKREKAEIKDAIEVKMLPGIPAKPALFHAYIDLPQHLIVVNASSARADELVFLLRDTLGALPASLLQVEDAPSHIMTNWVNADNEDYLRPNEFSLLDEFRLADEEGEITYRHVDTDSGGIKEQIRCGMQVNRLALKWRDRATFTVDDALMISKLKFLDVVHSAANDIEADDYASRFDADFTIMMGELREMLPELFKAFGGLTAINQQE